MTAQNKLNESLDVFTGGEFAQTIVIDGVSVSGILDRSYEPAFNYGVDTLSTEGVKITFLVQTSAIEGVEHGVSVEIDDLFFEVIGIESIDDGLLSVLVLKEVD